MIFIEKTSWNLARYWAHSRVNYALKNGFLVKQPCTNCGNPKSVAHHDDYADFLKIVWLCQSCHCRIHATTPQKHFFRNVRTIKQVKAEYASSLFKAQEKP